MSTKDISTVRSPMCLFYVHTVNVLLALLTVTIFVLSAYSTTASQGQVGLGFPKHFKVIYF